MPKKPALTAAALAALATAAGVSAAPPPPPAETTNWNVRQAGGEVTTMEHMVEVARDLLAERCAIDNVWYEGILESFPAEQRKRSLVDEPDCKLLSSPKGFWVLAYIWTEHHEGRKITKHSVANGWHARRERHNSPTLQRRSLEDALERSSGSYRSNTNRVVEAAARRGLVELLEERANLKPIMPTPSLDRIMLRVAALGAAFRAPSFTNNTLLHQPPQLPTDEEDERLDPV